jgi:hypothetical protein
MFENDKFYIRSHYKYLTEKLILEESRNSRRYINKLK